MPSSRRPNAVVAGILSASPSPVTERTTASTSCCGVIGLVRKSLNGGFGRSAASASTSRPKAVTMMITGGLSPASCCRITSATPTPSRPGMRQSISTTS
ncbi:Uncharacterised protein [Chromobacterium violaceum]|uniref:Uncharacterized protein n=1 Tax=Chromobacterium violaceum TaxID=536 RepID=A0A3S4HKZ2_CHRVL|nr:Uncharacterised protein [Chromobacterium violaceum]